MNNENSVIRSAISKIWNGYIKRDYEDGKIAYEGDLDFRLGHYLIENIEKKGYEVFAKPTLVNLDQKKPDYIICKNGKIMAFIELKHSHYPIYQEDFYKFIDYFKARNNFSEKLRLNPVTGNIDGDDYTISDDVQFYFCVIAKEDAVAVDCKSIRSELENDSKWMSNDQSLTTEVLKRVTVFYGKSKKPPEFGYCTFNSKGYD